MNVPAPVIFTTAFDQYTLKAFKVNSVDYLLKPIDEQELTWAIENFVHYISEKKNLLRTSYPARAGDERPLPGAVTAEKGQQLGILKVESLAYCFADGNFCYAVDFRATNPCWKPR